MTARRFQCRSIAVTSTRTTSHRCRPTSSTPWECSAPCTFDQWVEPLVYLYVYLCRHCLRRRTRINKNNTGIWKTIVLRHWSRTSFRIAHRWLACKFGPFFDSFIQWFFSLIYVICVLFPRILNDNALSALPRDLLDATGSLVAMWVELNRDNI